MRNTESGPNTEFSTWFSSCALARSWPKGFSTTTRRQGLRPSGRRLRGGQARALELVDDVGEVLGRHRQVEGVVPAGPALDVEFVTVCASRSNAASLANSPGTNLTPSESCCQTVSLNGVRAYSFTAW